MHANIVDDDNDGNDDDDDNNNDVNYAAVGRKRGGGEKRNELGPLGFSTFSCFGFFPSFYFSPPLPHERVHLDCVGLRLGPVQQTHIYK